MIAAAKASSRITDTGCWEWRFARNPAGYGVIGQGGKGGLVHRHVMAAALGRPIGREPVHHACANRACVNPDHLQLVTQQENMAEMFARNFYIRRIALLEAALAEVVPDHALLEDSVSYTVTSVTIPSTAS